MTKRAIITGVAGGAIAIAIKELLSAHSMTPLMIIPFATSIVLVIGSPDVEPAQPRAIRRVFAKASVRVLPAVRPH